MQLCNKAAKIMGTCLRAFDFFLSAFMPMLWTSYLWPVLEYSNQIWNKADRCHCLECIQKKFIKQISRLNNLLFEQNLLQTGLLPLYFRHFYLEFAFKLLRNIMDINAEECGLRLSKPQGSFQNHKEGLTIVLSLPDRGQAKYQNYSAFMW